MSETRDEVERISNVKPLEGSTEWVSWSDQARDVIQYKDKRYLISADMTSYPARHLDDLKKSLRTRHREWEARRAAQPASAPTPSQPLSTGSSESTKSAEGGSGTEPDSDP